MNLKRHQKILLHKKEIILMTEQLILENNQDIVVSELAKVLDMAK